MKMIDFNPCTENRFNKYDSAALLSSLDETVVTDCLMEEPIFSLHNVGPLYVLRHASQDSQLAPAPRLLRLGASGCLGRTGAVPATFSGGAPPLGNLGGGVSPSASGASPLVAIGGGAAPSASGASQR